MAQITVFFLILVASASCAATSKDAEVSCVYRESCVLPCSFEPGPDPIINWIKTEGDIPVYSYFYGRTQFQHQHKNYLGRASLSEEQLNQGKASLLLKEVKVQDEGRYVCLTSTSHGKVSTYINLKVYEDVGDVDVVREDSELTCRADGLHPEPAVAWYTGVPLTKAEGNTTVRQREDQLYDVHSSVSLQPGVKVWSCNVSTARSWRRASFILGGEIKKVLYNEAVLPCPVLISPIKSVLWKFNKDVIYNRTGSEWVYNDSWKPFVFGVTDFFHLVLKNLSQDQEGLYSCHISTDTETVIIVTQLKIQFWLPLYHMLLFLSCLLLVQVLEMVLKAARQPCRFVFPTKPGAQKTAFLLSPAIIAGENYADKTDRPYNPEEIPLRQKYQETEEESIT